MTKGLFQIVLIYMTDTEIEIKHTIVLKIIYKKQ